jgi:hypothetical protein
VVGAAVAAHHRPSPVLSGHVWDRLSERLTQGEREGIRSRFSGYIKAHPTGRHAVRVLKLDGRRGTFAGSNGDEVWVVLDHGEVRTVMLRRSSQPRNAQAFSVDRVHFAV